MASAEEINPRQLKKDGELPEDQVTTASARRRQRRAMVKMMGIGDAEARLANLDSSCSTVTEIMVGHEPLPLGTRLIYEQPLIPGQKSNQVTYHN